MLHELFVAQLFGIENDMFNYNDRKVADKVKLENGLEISSCYTSDKGYETAIFHNDTWYVVERYENKEDCVLGHSKWVEFAKTNPTTIPYITWDDEIEYVDLI